MTDLTPEAIAQLVKRMESVATMLDPEERFQSEWILVIREGTAALTALAEARGAEMVSVPKERMRQVHRGRATTRRPRAGREAMSELQRLDGLFVGQLDDDELLIFTRAVEQGKALRDYNHPAGQFLGLAKVKVLGGKP